MKNAFFETPHNEMKCVLSIKESNFNETRPSALGMSDPNWGPFIHIFVDEKIVSYVVNLVIHIICSQKIG